MMWPYGSGWGWGWMVGGWVMMVVFWGLVILGIVVLVRYLGSGHAPAGSARVETPLEILRRRYATGELTKEQFEQMKRDVA
jgi:putative membrane protein